MEPCTSTVGCEIKSRLFGYSKSKWKRDREKNKTETGGTLTMVHEVLVVVPARGSQDIKKSSSNIPET